MTVGQWKPRRLGLSFFRAPAGEDTHTVLLYGTVLRSGHFGVQTQTPSLHRQAMAGKSGPAIAAWQVAKKIALKLPDRAKEPRHSGDGASCFVEHQEKV